MWVWLDRFSLILFDAALSTGLFLSVVVFAMLVCRQPSRRLLIVRSSLLASLAIAPLVAVLPLPRVDVVGLILHADVLPPSIGVDSDAAHRASFEQAGFRRRLNSFITLFKSDYAAWAGRWLPRTLTLIVLTVAATGAAWVLLGFWGVRWLLRHSREPAPSTQAVYDGLSAGRTKEQVRPDVRVSASVQRPVLVGLRRPTILIPASYEEPGASAELLRLSLLHELAHADQSDPWFGTIASLAQSIWFYLPHVWWLRSQLMIDQEFMADHAASKRYGTPKGYAASLLALVVARPAAAGSSERRPGRRSIVSSTRKRRRHSPLFQRMLMLLHCPFPVEQDLPRRWSWSLKFVVIVASLASACVCVRWPHAHAIEHAPGIGALSGHEPFRVADFVVAPLVFTPGGRALPYHMPVALSSQFDLRVEVLSTVADLEDIHIAGHRLIGDPPSSRVVDRVFNPSFYTESWHQIRLRRAGNEVALWIDGRRSSAIQKLETTSEWLTFEPGPARPASFRNLVVEW